MNAQADLHIRWEPMCAGTFSDIEAKIFVYTVSPGLSVQILSENTVYKIMCLAVTKATLS